MQMLYVFMLECVCLFCYFHFVDIIMSTCQFGHALICACICLCKCMFYGYYCVCISICRYVSLSLCIYDYICVYMIILMCTCCEYLHLYIYIDYTWRYMFICVSVYIFLCVWISVSMCVFVCVYFIKYISVCRTFRKPQFSSIIYACKNPQPQTLHQNCHALRPSAPVRRPVRKLSKQALGRNQLQRKNKTPIRQIKYQQ